MEFGDRLKSLREQKGYSQADLCKRLGIEQSTLANYENNRRMPKIEMLFEIAKIFDVSVAYLTGKSVFMNTRALYEPWGRTGDGLFEATFDFGDLLRKERKAEGIPAEPVSRYLGVTVSDLYGFEDGSLPMPRKYAQKYAEFLDRTISEIFYDNQMFELITIQDVDELEERDALIMETLGKAELLDLIAAEGEPASKLTLPKFPSVFTDPKKAREYLAMHQIFGSDGFNNSDIEDMSDDEVIEFANEAMKMLEMVSYKYKK